MPPTTIADLLALLSREPGQPRITWYGDGGERVELSGAVLQNWVAKTANLLVEEFDVAPGTRVRLDLPPHWRTVVWALATWRLGACAVVGAEPADVIVTDDPTAHEAGPDLVVVSLPALARRFAGDLPPRAVDAASAVMTYADVLGWTPDVDLRAPALVSTDLHLTHAELLVGAPTEPARTALTASTDRGPDELLATVRVLAAGGSVVLLARGAVSPDRYGAVLAQEHVTDDRGTR